MSSLQEGSSGGGTTSRRTERSRRSWTELEEATLISSLKELIAQGWKSDNGFRTGYLLKLEAALHQAFPETDLKASPHVNSKLASWKKNYYSLSMMLNRSGVGFNLRGTYMIEANDEQWDQIVKMDPNARLMRYKPWPYYYDWQELFGSDRATGENAEDMHEADDDLNRGGGPVLVNGIPTQEEEASFENETNEAAYDRVSQSARDEHLGDKHAKKRKVTDGIAGICELLSEMNQSTNTRLEHLANRIGYEFDMGKARQETFDQLGEIPGLSRENRFILTELVAFKAERLDIWRGMKGEARAHYVEHLLNYKGP